MFASKKVYPNEPPVTTARPESRGVSHRRIIEEAKSRVETIALADLLCGPGKMRKVGERWVSRCPLPDHEDRSPSFTVYPGGGGWFCFGCQRGGDVVDLAAAAWDYKPHEMKMAAAELLHRFDYEIPAKPASWHRKQKRQAPVRDAVEEVFVEHFARRLFRRFLPIIEAVEDEDERREEADVIWAVCVEIGVLWRASRLKERSAS